MKKPIRLIFILAVLAAAGYGGWYFLLRDAAAEGMLVLHGNIEVDESALAFRVSGLLAERLVAEGDPVAAGDTVARLDTAELAQQLAVQQAALGQAEAQLASVLAGARPEQVAQARALAEQARARLGELEAGARPQEVAQAEDAVAQARAQLERAQADEALKAADLERARVLFAEGVVPEQQLDVAETAWAAAVKSSEAAAGQLEQARAALSLVAEGPRGEQVEQARQAYNAAQARYAEAANGPTAEQIAQAEAAVTAAEAALELTRTHLSFAELTAPFSGYVLSEALEPGEFASPGAPVLTIGKLEEVHLRAFLPERELGRIKRGQQVDVFTDSYPGKAYRGTITFIADEAEFTPKTVETREQRVRLVYRVKITVPNPERELKAGMPAEVRIPLDGGGA